MGLGIKTKVLATVRRYTDGLAFARRVSETQAVKVVLGASGTFEEGWIPSEQSYFDILNPEHWRRYFARRPIEALLAEHVWEHLTPEHGVQAARLCFEHLAKGGYLRVAVPDGLHPDPAYIEAVRPGGSGPGCDDHKILYDFRSFQEIFEKAGFEVRLLEYFDEKGQFHAVDWAAERGLIHRSKRFDERNRSGKLNYTSIILDAVKR